MFPFRANLLIFWKKNDRVVLVLVIWLVDVPPLECSFSAKRFSQIARYVPENCLGEESHEKVFYMSPSLSSHTFTFHHTHFYNKYYLQFSIS